MTRANKCCEGLKRWKEGVHAQGRGAAPAYILYDALNVLGQHEAFVCVIVRNPHGGLDALAALGGHFECERAEHGSHDAVHKRSTVAKQYHLPQQRLVTWLQRARGLPRAVQCCPVNRLNAPDNRREVAMKARGDQGSTVPAGLFYMTSNK